MAWAVMGSMAKIQIGLLGTTQLQLRRHLVLPVVACFPRIQPDEGTTFQAQQGLPSLLPSD
jgi:hypothetical protein